MLPPNMHILSFAALTVVLLLPTWGVAAGLADEATSTEANISPTPLDDYVAAPDDTYSWEVVGTAQLEGGIVYQIDLKSQSWLTPEEVDRVVWQHWLSVIVPDNARSDVAMMFIGGGANGRDVPRTVDGRVAKVAAATQTVVAALGTIPNQPLVFHGDGEARGEDDLIGYTWDHFIKTGDIRWPARLPMTKSVVRAMDTVQALMRSGKTQGPEVNRFVVAGGSKRGWTTWTTAAVDKRVAGIAPIVIDVLNTDVSMRHHFAAYGFWAPAVGDYVQHKIPQRRHWPRYKELLQIVDPFAYRNRYTMPKCVINASGDEFFVPDSSQFYFDELPGEKHLCYVPNGSHSLDGTDALDTLVAFHYAIAHGKERPQISWTFPDAETIRVETAGTPVAVKMWSAHNPSARDFRVDTIGQAYQATELTEMSPGIYVANQEKPEKGWTAYFAQLEFDIGAPTPLRLTSPVRVTPDTLPFASVVPPVIDQEVTSDR